MNLRGILEGTAIRLVAEVGLEPELLQTLENCLADTTSYASAWEFGLSAEWHLLKRQDTPSTWLKQWILVGQGPCPTVQFRV